MELIVALAGPAVNVVIATALLLWLGPRFNPENLTAIDNPAVSLAVKVAGRAKTQAIGPSRGGQTTKIHVLTDVLGRPAVFRLTPGNVSDIRVADALIEAAGPTPKIKREMRRRAAIEPVIGHLKGEHRVGRNHLAQACGDAVNAIHAAAGDNFSLQLTWLRLLWLRLLIAPGEPAYSRGA